MRTVKVFICTESIMYKNEERPSGQVKKFVVDTTLKEYELFISLRPFVKDSYKLIIIGNRRNTKWHRHYTLDEVIPLVSEVRFYKSTLCPHWERKTEEVGCFMISDDLAFKVWDNSDTPEYARRTFIKFKCISSTVKPNIEGIIERFESIGIKAHKSKSDDCIWMYDNYDIKTDKTYLNGTCIVVTKDVSVYSPITKTIEL